jgi:hypothetical protein
MINPATFILMVIIGGSPPQQHGSYHHCYEAAQSEITSLGPDVRWDCVPTSRYLSAKPVPTRPASPRAQNRRHSLARSTGVRFVAL